MGGVGTFTNAPTIDKLQGAAWSVGGSGGLAVTGGIDFTYFSDKEGNEYSSMSIGIGAGPIPAELHANVSGALVIHLWNWKWLYNQIYNLMNDYFDELSCEEGSTIKDVVGVE